MHNIDDLPIIKAHMEEAVVPWKLYYYTDPGTLVRIVESGDIWGGLPQQMNDRAELKHALETLRTVADDVASAGPGDALVREFARYVAKTPWADVIIDAQPAFLISLSEERDSLPQWRAYCPRSGGVCLSLPGELVRQAVESNCTAGLSGATKGKQWFLAKCVYDESTAEKLMGALLAHHAQLFADTAQPGKPDWDGFTTSQGDRVAHLVKLISDAQIYGSFIKHPSFKHEAEWRLVCVNPDIEPSEISHAAGRDGVRAFLPFKLLERDADPIDKALRPEVWIGPTATPGASDCATKSLLEKWVGKGNALIHHTDSTYH